MGNILDLHIHTKCSDGLLSPREIVDQAVKNSVDIISIADHDSVEAYTDDLFNYAKEKGITVIPAVEISAQTKQCGIHVLGYNIDYKNVDLLKNLFSIRNARHDYLRKVSKKLEELGYIINTFELEKIDIITKAHIANDIINNLKNYNRLLEQFGHIPDKGEFIETIMNEGCLAFVKKNTLTIEQAAFLIRSAGGKVVLAHPVAYKYENNLEEADILTLVNKIKADGIESNYIYIDKYGNKINEIEIWNEFAKKHNLKVTIGSDFHNDDEIHPKIGLVGEDINLSKEDINSILDWLL